MGLLQLGSSCTPGHFFNYTSFRKPSFSYQQARPAKGPTPHTCPYGTCPTKTPSARQSPKAKVGQNQSRPHSTPSPFTLLRIYFSGQSISEGPFSMVKPRGYYI